MSLRSTFGPLEVRVLEALWARQAPACVRDLQPHFDGVAYTTLMTTLDRLFRKGTPKSSQQELMSELAGSTFATLLPGDAAAVRPILSMFVDTVGDRDHALLDELEQLVKARRDELKGRSSK